MRKPRVLQWWPAAAFVALAAAAGVLALAAGISLPEGGSESRARGPASQATTATVAETAPPDSPDASCAQAQTPAPSSLEPTLFDTLSDGASTDDPDFEATFDAEVGDDSARAHSNVTLEMHVPDRDVAPTAFYILIPPEWGVTPGCQIPIGLVVGKLRWDAVLGLDGEPCNNPAALHFTMLNASTDTSETVSFLDADDDGDPDFAQDDDNSGRPDVLEKYPDFLKRLFPGREPLRRSAGLFTWTTPPILAQSLVFQSLLDESDDMTLVIVLQNLGDPEASPGESGFTDYCTPGGFRMTDDGAGPAGAAFYTNPPAGEYTFILTAFGERDAEGDGIENALDSCPFDVNVGNPRVRGEGDADLDGLDAACDPNDFDSNPDQDGDGHLNRADICPLTVEPEGATAEKDGDGDQIGDECDTSANGPTVADGDVPLVIEAAEVTIR